VIEFPVGLFARMPEMEHEYGSPFAGFIYLDVPVMQLKSTAVARKLDEIVNEVQRGRETAQADSWMYFWRHDPPEDEPTAAELQAWSAGCLRFLMVTNADGYALTYSDNSRTNNLRKRIRQ
jgi:hypothetical protein